MRSTTKTKIVIEFNGDGDTAVEDALQRVLSQVQEGYTSGYDLDFHWTITAK